MKAIVLIVVICVAVAALLFYKKSDGALATKEPFTSSSSSNVSAPVAPPAAVDMTLVDAYYGELLKSNKWNNFQTILNTYSTSVVSTSAAATFLTAVNEFINKNPPSTGTGAALFDTFVKAQINANTSGFTPEQQSALSNANTDKTIFKGFDSNLGMQQPAPAAPKNQGSSSSSFSGSLPVGPYNPVADRPATVAELNEFKGNLNAEIIRLNASGSTDEVTRARITNLRKSLNFIQEIINQVNSKTLPENKIPIMKSSIDAAMTSLNHKSPLPDIFTGTDLDSFLKNLLPSNLANDPEVARTISEYLKSMTKNLSWNFGVKYTSNAEHDIAKYYNNAAGQGAEDLTNMNLARAGGAVEHQPTGFGSTAPVTDHHANTPQEACRGPASFDWKKRSSEICRALKARGENTEDYGCMPEGVNVGANFSYRGYARMICTRIEANYDTGLGGLVGCPPLDWPGWRK